MNIYSFSILDVLPYFVLLIVILGIHKFGGNKKALVVFLLLTVFSSIRYGIGYDYFTYCDMIKYEDFDRIESEIISVELMRLASFFGWNQLYFIINAVVSLYAIYYVVKRFSVNPTISLLFLYLMPMFYLESFSVVRNFSAYSIVLLSFYFLYEKKFWLYVLSVFVAGLFHSSGFVGFLLLPICLFKLNRKTSVLIFISSFFISVILKDLIMSLSGNGRIFTNLQNYAAMSRSQGQFMLYIIAFYNIINLLFWDKLRRKNDRNIYYLNIINIGSCIWFMLSFDHTLSLRIATFFLFFHILLLPEYFYLFRKKYQPIINTGVLLFFIAVYTFGFVNVIVATRKDNSKISNVPYQTIFFGKRYSNQ